MVWLDVFLVAISVSMVVVATTTLVFQLYKWWRPEHNDPDRYGTPGEPELPGAILVPMRDEVAVAGSTLRRLSNLDHPRYWVVPIVDHEDDMATARIAHAAARQNPERVLVCPYPEDNPVHNKPIGLNRAIRMLHDLEIPYEWVGIADAEDLFHPDAAADGRPPVPDHRRRDRAVRRAADERDHRPGRAAAAAGTAGPGPALVAGARQRLVAGGQRAGVLQVVPVPAQAAGRGRGDARSAATPCSSGGSSWPRCATGTARTGTSPA